MKYTRYATGRTNSSVATPTQRTEAFPAGLLRGSMKYTAQDTDHKGIIVVIIIIMIIIRQTITKKCLF